MTIISEVLTLTTIKHNFSEMFAYDNPFVGAIVLVNEKTGHFFAYSVLMLIFGVSFYVAIRKTNDLAKSLISSTHILMLCSVLLFFAGKSISIVIISEVFMLGILVLEALAIAGTIYLRSNKT